jgi:CBS domain-containing protein
MNDVKFPTQNDVTLRTQNEVLDEALGTVRQAMTQAVLILQPDMRMGDAAAMLRRYGVGGAPVLDAGRLIGIVTEADLLANAPRAQTTGLFLRPGRGRTDRCVRDVMSAGPIVACVDEPLTEAILRMGERGVDRLPVVDPRLKLVGILAREDVVHAVARAVRRTRAATEGPRSWMLKEDPDRFHRREAESGGKDEGSREASMGSPTWASTAQPSS